MAQEFGIVGLGTALPKRVRTSEDPIFDHIRKEAASNGISEAALFYGNRQHHVLGPDETLAQLAADAARAALADARLATEQVDRLYGAISLSEYLAPAELYRVHELLGLRSNLMTLPLQGEFTNFVLSLITAWEALKAGHCQHPLIATGAGWTRNMDYRRGSAFGIGDGAAAVVLGASESLTVQDWEAETLGSQYQAMTLRSRAGAGSEQPTFALEEDGMRTFLHLGMEGAPALVGRLLERSGLRGDDITFIGHQASRKLMDHWNAKIRPRDYFDTLEDAGNLIFASVPFTLARYRKQLRTPYLVLYGIGIGSVAQVAVLLRV